MYNEWGVCTLEEISKMSKQTSKVPGSGGFAGSKSGLPNVDKRTILESGCNNARELCAAIKDKFRRGVEALPIGKTVKVSCTAVHYDAIKAYIKEHKE